MSFDLYSQTPASNDLANYFQTGMRPSAVKNAGWDIMADLAQFMALPTAGGTANAQTITNVRACGAWFTGMWVCWMPQATNTAAMTIAPDGLAAKNVFCNGAAAIAGQVVLGVPAIGRYDGTQVQLINPQRSTGSFTLTLTGVTASGTVNYGIEPSGKTAGIWGTGIIGSSSSTSMTGTGVPSILVTTTSKSYIIPVESGSASVAGAVITGTSTTWTFGAPGTTGFSASGTKGLGTSGTPFGWIQNLD